MLVFLRLEFKLIVVRFNRWYLTEFCRLSPHSNPVLLIFWLLLHISSRLLMLWREGRPGQNQRIHDIGWVFIMAYWNRIWNNSRSSFQIFHPAIPIIKCLHQIHRNPSSRPHFKYWKICWESIGNMLFRFELLAVP